MDIVIIRHGQSEADLLGVHEGRADFSLTDLGREQAALMAEKVTKRFSPNKIWASPLKRAHETASILSQKCGVPLLLEDDLMEYNNGVLAGLPREVAAQKYPLPPGGRLPHEAIEAGESVLDFRLRVERVFSKIIAESGNAPRIAIVAHGGTISNILKSFLKLPPITEYGFSTGDTGIHYLRITDNNRLILWLNNTEHLVDLQKDEV
ncbi:histidine phosphatase family protein [Bacillus luteolus]|uniref:Histidine phosphatase family protein n=1 Tax=Litchfieldia luteola TaxID=682179 RepID=A0ABR9QG44_9BACI|nr:histidine phosphatase family protein [Cytobacillus luteolus]MBE4907465.1 histidine phosphatase family protein [Cytobacillus luteolus]MBP1944232.1 2,3-bisphosphoglycerate-dependent phosphoglycerate mutase [Cytobacillus luteolus]